MIPDIIDVHAHCIPEGLHERVLASDPELGVSAVTTAKGLTWRFDDGFTTAPIEPLMFDPDARVARMDASGVAVQLLSGFIDTGAHHAERSGVGYARAFNDALADTVALHPDRFLGLGTLPLLDPEAAATEVRRLVLELGFVGVELPAASVRQPELEPVWAAAADLGAVVLVHPEASTTSDLPYFTGNFVANPAETTAAAAALILSGVLERFVGLQVVLVHGGGFLPYQYGRLAHGFAQYGGRFGAKAAVDPREQLRLMYYDTVLHDPVALMHLINVVGVDRVLAGTDDPFAMADSDPAATIAGLSGLSEDERNAIRRGNAERLLAAVAGSGAAAILAARHGS